MSLEKIMKLSHIVQSSKLIMGISSSHVLSDATSCLHFMNIILRFYQKLEPLKPDPIFERRLRYENEADQSFLSAMTSLRYAQPKE